MMLAALTLLRRFWREALLLLAVAALVWLGYSWRGLSAERDIAQQQAAQAHRVAMTTQRARAAEHAAAANDAAASAQYQKGLEDGKKELDGAIARLRAALRLRDQQLTAARAGNLPATASGAGRCDGEAGADFLAAHGEDALRLAAEADDVVRQLSACQVILQADYANE
ncbi:lysis system i-spanin subunit Rz (plasmid) [Chromobacterium amazonense]|uniref:lysis system i-spanin subunit Rz n=1 Tax=Chromobacterium amazonense TaxID=1382803 RepID=UPI00237E0047|nr:lysis system i-spanin subunit Rz [Chromobacterium amazonense]MDE1714956.1 lysis system i-spanin subunit Rz [Chromobacterium amazonense]